MPTVSVFFGISIRLYFDEHHPPHFHAYYGGASVQVSIDTLHVLHGRLPSRAMALVLEWAFARRGELRQNWDRARRHEPLLPIDPLI